MPWVKLDDQFFLNPKVQAAGPQAVALHLAGMCWTAGQLTDGAIPKHVLPVLAAQAGVGHRTVARLVDAGLWDVTPDGWVVHDWLDWNPPAEKVRSERAAARERMAKVRANKGRTFEGSSASPSPSPSVPTEQSRGSRSGNPEPHLIGLPAYQTFDPDAPVCQDCEGMGRIFETGKPCKACDGTGRAA